MFRSRLSSLIALFLCLALPLPAFGQGEKWTPQHVAKLRSVTAAAISPDGRQIAYVLSVPRDLPKEKDGPSWAELHVVALNPSRFGEKGWEKVWNKGWVKRLIVAGDSTPYVSGQVNVDSIAWTPDGKSISFLAKRDQDKYRSLYVIPARGGEARKVLAHDSDLTGYSWSPDSKQVAFLATAPAAADRSKRQSEGFSQEVYEEDVPPVRVWIADLESKGLPCDLDLKGSASEVHFAPVGDKLAVALAPTPLIDGHLMFRKVHIVDVRTGFLVDLKNPGKIGQFAWSPDGQRLALIAARDEHDPLQGRLWVHDADSKAWVDVLPDFAGHVESVFWRDPTKLLVQAAVGASTTLGTVSLERTTAGKVSFSGLKKIGGTGDLILSNIMVGQGCPVYIAQTPQHAPELYYQAGQQAYRLTDCNPWLQDMAFAEQEVVKYRARDGLKLEGVLVRPLGAEKGERYPLVMTVHGGPESHISNGWVTLYHALGQVGAARGFAVFYPNYRGSTGRGVEFSMMGQKEAGGKEFDDLVDAVDHLVKMGLVDEKKVGITGGSYGGYATAWGSTYYSDRFAAGVMFVGISDWISCSGTTDIPYEMNLVHHRKWLWDDWNYFAKSSPIHYVEKSKTPLLILHGKSDPRVHPSQSLELYRHLKVRGKAPVRLVLYPGEGHGNRRAASRLDYNIRLLQWMEHYLKGPGGAPPPYEIDYGLGAPTESAAESSGGRPVRRPRFLDEQSSDDARVHRFCGRRGCPCCIGP
jgi:dipeptidyl aminopeptidase/acylaminoacyl peptidase